MCPSVRVLRFVFLLVLFSMSLATPSGAYVPAKLLEPNSPYASPWGFGHSVSSAGDWNGDGYQDVIVGFEDLEGTGTGHAALYLGGPFATKVFYRLFHGENTDDRFGYAVSSAGDFNGDGYGDIAVGAPWYDTGENDAGALYIFYGGPGIGANGDANYDLKITEAVPGEPGMLLGFSLAAAGDQNGDGYDDLFVGVPRGGPGGLGHGRADLYLGGPGAGGPPDVTFFHSGQQWFEGYSVGAADVNHDGFKDLITGAPLLWGGSTPGRAFVWLGGPLTDNTSDFDFIGEANDDNFGIVVGSAGDLNGDGWEDVVVGAPGNDSGGASNGRVYVYWGGGFMTSPGLVITGVNGEGLGKRVSTAGNLDGDLDDELIVRSVWGPSTVAYVYHGGPSVDTIADIVIGGGPFDGGVATVGDFNGDSLDDFVVGDPGYNGGSGRVTVYAGKSFKLKLPKPGQLVYMGSQIGVQWVGSEKADAYTSTDGGATWSLALADIGGDDENRVSLSVPAVQTEHARVRLVTAGQRPSVLNSDETGEFRIVRPSTPPSPVTWARWSSPGASSERRGWAMASAGDWNGDGYADLIAGAPLSEAPGAATGRAYIYFGGPVSDGVADRTLIGEAAGDFFGYAVAGIGDVNADGYADVAVGAPFRNGATGAAYVYFGGGMGDTAPDLLLPGLQLSEGFGLAIAPAGDLNADRYADFAVGAPSYDVLSPSLTDAGVVRVYFGGPAVDDVADLEVLGSLPSEAYGNAIAGGGDLNGDGFGDLLVGAPLANGETGRAEAIFGGPAVDNVADGGYAASIVGERFGASVAIPGDVNGDGIADAVIGAPFHDGNRGRVAVYVNPGPPTAGIQPGPPNTEAQPGPPNMRGEAPGDFFGSAVAGVADVNGDGLADFAVGAPINDAGGSNAGRVYVVLGTPQLDMQADVVLTGATAEENAGRSIAWLPPSRCCGFGTIVVGGDQSTASVATPGVIRSHDLARFRLVSPAGGETWPVGALRDVRWLGSETAWLELSVDGGSTWTTLAENLGGRDVNQVSIRVPHAPSRFAMVRINPGPPNVGSNPGPPDVGGQPGPPDVGTQPGPPTGAAASDSFFTIQTSVALLALLASPAPDGAGATITWKSDPGPEDLAGYRLESASGAGPWRTIASLVRGTSYHDPDAAPAARYRLFAVNGLQEELLLGETSLRPVRPLAAWPTPYRGGNLTVSFATASAMGGAAAPTEVALYDIHGRRVRTVERGEFPAGHRVALWDGRDDAGRPVGAGIYFLRVRSAGLEETMKLSVLR